MQAVRTFKPRRRALSPAQAAAFDERLARWGVAEEGPLLDLDLLTARSPSGAPSRQVLDIGVGHGEATVELAAARPDEHVVAVEVHTPGVSRLLAEIEARGLTNVRVVHGDALVLLDRIPLGSLDEIRVWFPDPWPKRRHHHRRLLRPDVARRFADRLLVGGRLHVATDVCSYADHALAAVAAEPRLTGGVVARPAWRPETRFERSGRAAGRSPIDLLFTRTADAS